MPPTAVLVLDDTRSVIRQGEVVAKGDKSTYHVRWEDGAEDPNIRLGRQGDTECVLVPRNGLRHLGFAAPEVLVDLLANRPALLFLAAISEAGGPQTGAALVRTVSVVVPGDVGAAWKVARRELEAAENVAVEGSPKRYRWSGPKEDVLPAAPALAAPLGPLAEAAGLVDQQGPGAGHEVRENLTDPTDRVERDVSPDQYTAKPRSLAAVIESARRAMKGGDDERRVLLAETRSRDLRVRLLAALAANVPEVIDPAELARTPLATGVALGDLPDDLLAAAADRWGRPLLVALMGLPRASELLERSFPMSDAEAGSLLLRAKTELGADARAHGGSSGLRAPFEQLFGRVAGASIVPLDVALHILRGLETGPQGPEFVRFVLDWLSDAVLRVGVDGWGAISRADRSTLEAWARRVPLTANGARSRFLAAVHGVGGVDVAEPGWWSGITWDDLVAATTGPLVRVVTSDAVRQGVVRPLAVDALASAMSRSRLLSVLAAPAVLSDAIEPADAASAVRGLRLRDKQLSGWVAAIADESSRAELERSLASAEAARVVAAEAREAAEARAQESFQRGLRLEAELAAAREATSGLRASQERQVRLDSMKALADVAAYVDGALDRQTSDNLRARVSALLRRQRILPSGEVGAVVPHDPVLHDVVGGQPEPGQRVRVVRVGYTWDTPDGPVTLTRALAERVEGES